jgi:hypothetical protein
MSIPRHQSSGPRLLGLLSLLLSIAVVSTGQELIITNCFPTNLFLTDENRLFSYKKGQRFVEAKRIEEAQKSKESRPAEQDPEGHWGKVVDGLQLSLRFEKQEFTNGEPILATILMRNVSDKPLNYIRQTVTGHPCPIHVSVWEDQQKLNLKTDENGILRASASNVRLYPRTQHKYRLRLDRFYDLSKAGTYSVQAEYGPRAPNGPFPVRAPGREEITSQKAAISITNAPAR